MARLPRLSLPGYPHHILHRGNNRQAIFLDPADYQFMLDLLDESARRHEVAVHAYVLMPNHFHLLVTPKSADGLARMMQAIGRRYVQYFNRRHGRSGTLWEGRYKSTVIEARTHLLDCMVYIDLNPVRAGLVAAARDYAWSSHDHYIGLRSDKLVTPHPIYWEMDNTPFGREAAYSSRVQGGLQRDTQLALTDSVLHGWALGTSGFKTDVEKKAGRRVSRAKAGRPSLERPVTTKSKT